MCGWKPDGSELTCMVFGGKKGETSDSGHFILKCSLCKEGKRLGQLVEVPAQGKDLKNIFLRWKTIENIYFAKEFYLAHLSWKRHV